MAEKVEAKIDAKDEKAAPAAGAKKGKKAPRNGVIHIKCTFNNTLVTITDAKGNVVSWSSAGPPLVRQDIRRCSSRQGTGSLSQPTTGPQQ